MYRCLALSGCFVIALVHPVLAQDRPREPTAPEIRTEASAQRAVRPDHAKVTLEFSAVGASPREAGKRLAARADSLRRKLQALGIPRDSLSTSSRWYWWRGRIETLPGPTRYVSPPPGTPGPTLTQQDTAYRAHDAVEIRTSDLEKVSPAIDAAMELGITQISGVHFSATKTDAAREEALKEATARARRQATAMAEAIGAKLGRTLSLNTQSGAYQEPYGISSMTVRGGQGGGAPTEVVEPMIPVKVTVYGRWELVSTP